MMLSAGTLQRHLYVKSVSAFNRSRVGSATVCFMYAAITTIQEKVSEIE